MTARTPEDTLGQGHALSVTACLVAACLGCVGWIHQDHSATGAFCLVRKVLDELVPGCITNSLGKTMVMDHVVDSQVLNGYDPTPVDNFPGLLVSEVGSPVGDPLMHSGERLPSLPATRGALCFLFQEPVNALQVFFVSPEEPWILDLGAIAHRGKAGQPHGHVLQDLAVDRGQTGTLLLKVRQCSLLVIQTETSARLLIRCLSFFKKVVVQPATFVKSSVHDCLLSRCRVQAVLECFTHL